MEVRKCKEYLLVRNRNYAILWTGQSISLFGIAVYSTGVPFLVFNAGGNAMQLSLAHSFFIIPQIFFLLVSGVLVDHWPRKQIIVICDTIRGLAVGGIVVLIISGKISLWHIYLLTCLLGFVSTFYRPAVRGMTPQIVAPSDLVAANSFRTASQQISEMAGPLFGGLLIASSGIAGAFGVTAASLLLSAAAVTFVSVKQLNTDASGSKKLQFLAQFKDGWAVLIEKPWLGASIAIGSAANIGIASFDVIILPVLAEQEYDGVVTYSWILSSMAAGALLCAVLIGKLDRVSRRGILYYSFMALTGIGILLLALKPAVWLLLPISALIGFCMTAFIIIWESTIQALIKQDLIGRVTSVQMFGGLALLPLGYAIFARLIEQFEVTVSITAAGCLIMAVSATGIGNRKIRELD